MRNRGHGQRFRNNWELSAARSIAILELFARRYDIPESRLAAAGYAETVEQEEIGTVSVDATTLGLSKNKRAFALKVRGDSMIGKFICDGDIVILEHGPDPRNGDIVAALIDRKTTLKTFIQKGPKQYLKAENPKYPNLIPSDELVIQGVYKGLIRKA